MLVRFGLYKSEKRYQAKPEEYADKIMTDAAFANEFLNYVMMGK